MHRTDAMDVVVGERCSLPFGLDDVRSVAECRSPHFDVWVDGDSLVVTASSEGCGVWRYVDLEGRERAHRICVVPRID